LSRNRLYLLLGVLILGGYIWLLINLSAEKYKTADDIGVCIIKHSTNIPCPSCGSTRAVLLLLNGEFLKSLYWNPFGVFILTVMLTLPVWLLYDFVTSKDTLFRFYKKAEKFIQQKTVAIIAILLVLTNWIWNIYKDL
jgi:hypothetical protein